MDAQSLKMIKAPPRSRQPPTDFKAQLPVAAKVIIGQNFSDWAFKTDMAEYENNSAPLQICHLNDDTLPDYALHIVSRLKADTVEHFLTVVSNGESYELFTLQSVGRADAWFGLYYQEIYKRGTEFDSAPFGEEGDNRRSFTTDCISISMSDKNSCTVYLFQHNEFRAFSPCE